MSNDIKLKKIDFYWSDRWRRIISVFKCTKCGKEVTNLDKNKSLLEKDHIHKWR